MNRLILFNIKDQTLQIFAFWMININWMISRLMNLMQDAHLTSSLCSSGEDSLSEIVLSDYLRTTEGKQDSAWLNLFKSFDVQSGVTTQTILQCVTMLCKGRWVKNDKVILTIVIIKILKSILSDSQSMTRIIREVEFDILIRQFDSLSRTVHRMYHFCPTTHSINRETTRVTEHIQYTSSLCIIL